MILPLGKTRSRLAFDVPNARAKGRGRAEPGGNTAKHNPRPLERRVRLLLLLLILAFRSGLLNIRRNTRSTAIVPYSVGAWEPAKQAFYGKRQDLPPFFSYTYLLHSIFNRHILSLSFAYQHCCT